MKHIVRFTLSVATVLAATGCNQKEKSHTASFDKGENGKTASKDPVQTAFTRIYQLGKWGRDADGKGYSGAGSSVENSRLYMTLLQDFLEKNAIKSVVDLGCGDWSFSRYLDWEGINYIGVDVVQPVIEKNIENFAREGVSFYCANGADSDLPEADLLICKDVMQHLPINDIFAICQQLPKFKYCLITNDLNCDTPRGVNSEISPGKLRGLDLTTEPFKMEAKNLCTYLAHDDVMKQILLIERK